MSAPRQPDHQSQAATDARQAWVLAANCRLYENDPGPATLNIGAWPT